MKKLVVMLCLYIYMKRLLNSLAVLIYIIAILDRYPFALLATTCDILRMRRIFGLLCIFLACFYAVTSSEQTPNTTRNTSDRPTKINPNLTGKDKPPAIGSFVNTTKPTILWPRIKCDATKSCEGRCTLSREFQNPKDNNVNCLCDPWCNSVFHDCCMDYNEHCNASFVNENTSKTELDELWSCTKVDDTESDIWTIAKCHNTWKNEEIATKCTTPNTLEISTQIPVIDNNNVTFRNRYCAICNGVSVYEPWKFKVKCNAEPTSNYTEEESWQFTDYFCQSEFLQRTFSSRGIRYCYDVIKECKTESSDRDKRNCEESPTGLVAGLRSYKNYKNLDCLLCNSDYRPVLTCGPWFSKHIGQKVVIPRPYSAIFTSSADNSFTSYSRCPAAHIYNARSRICSKLFGGNIEKKSQQLLQIFAVVLKYEATQDEMCTLARGMEIRFGYVFQRLLKVSLIELNLEFSDLKIHKQNDSSFVVTFQLMGLKEDLGDGQDVPLEYSKIQKLTYHATFNKDMGRGICRYFLTKRVAREMTCVENVTFIAANMSKVFPNGTLRVSLNLTQSYYNEGEFLEYNETFWAICKDVKPLNCSYFAVLPNASDFILFPNRSIYSRLTNSVFDYGEYSIVDSKVWVCLQNDLVWKANKIQSVSTSIHTTILSYVTLVSLTISVQSLCALIIVYSLNKSLRNLPGKNLMLLCGTLAFAQTLWLIEGNINTTSVLCTVAAIASHFAFLSSFCSSGSIAIHSFLTFRRLAKGKLYNANNTRVFLWYFVYSTGLPAFWVSLCWILHRYQVISLRNKTTNNCWIGNSEGLTIAFLYPAALQLFVNVTLLLVTLRQIQKCNKASRQLQQKNGATNERRVGIYLRMSTLMGLSWLFGVFVVVFPRVVVFNYFFVFGNGFQGLYIALAFLLTRNVKKILVKRLTKNTGRSTSQTLANSDKTKE